MRPAGRGISGGRGGRSCKVSPGLPSPIRDSESGSPASRVGEWLSRLGRRSGSRKDSLARSPSSPTHGTQLPPGCPLQESCCGPSGKGSSVDRGGQ
eukprot:9272511-Heterocapsa_arctica.AAC.1